MERDEIVRPRTSARATGRPVVLLLVCAAAVTAAVLPMPTGFVERFYSRSFYLWLQPSVTRLSNLVPFALLDVMILALSAGFLMALARTLVRRRGRLRACMHLAGRIAGACSILYLLFLLLWGLNYRREALVQRLDYRADRVTDDSLLRFVRAATERVNDLHSRTSPSGWSELQDLPRTMGSAFRSTQELLAAPALAVPGRPKMSLLSFYFRRSAIDGMIDPYLLEVIVNGDVLPFERPFVVAHEWAHLAGFADESEASFVGWLICLQGDAGAQYSGWLALFSHAVRHLGRPDRATALADLDPGPRVHLQAIAERLRRATPAVRSVARGAYDRFLKANRVRDGIASYDAVVNLVLGTRFEGAWVPVVVR